MNHLLTCTTEELALMVSAIGHHNVAKGIAESAIGEKSEKEWIAILEATSKQLILKQMWDEERESKGENPLTKETTDFLTKYVTSKRIIRCSNAPQKVVLMLHHYEGDEWLSHIIDRDIIHEFSLISSEEISDHMKAFYGITYENYEKVEPFSLSDRSFDLLSNPTKIDKVRKKSKFTPSEVTSFNHFIEDLKQFDWTLFNISNFNIVTPEEEIYLENIIFFLPSSKGVWISEYIEDPKKPVYIYLADQEQWENTLKDIGAYASYQMQNS
ncbi:hypothetical protein [Pseudalkalibacillus hwajinpoensis]|uniref:hypothetical protein n=1 Tax=Guptibacillus hwajinpoensis TaxID=208199 RepID=UPI001CD2150E|nr:hypothetical protein [Pseudalkalibacillus hwajinpoensis]MCA0993825.1 hypothetical protein [Pseudalkalibacillus hwajinpoensis]